MIIYFFLTSIFEQNFYHRLPSGQILQKKILSLLETVYECQHPLCSNILYTNDKNFENSFSSEDWKYLQVPKPRFSLSFLQANQIKQKLKKELQIPIELINEYEDDQTSSQANSETIPDIIIGISIGNGARLSNEPGFDHYVNYMVFELYVTSFFIYMPVY
jgi:hypothetical protein